MPNILAIVSQYELLGLTALYLSAIDLLSLARTCSASYAHIRKNEAIFERLKRFAICDGRGLKARQEYQGLYAIPQEDLGVRAPNCDEELEIRVWNLKCDAVNALPCSICAVNVCEECRYVPRVREGWGWMSRQKPHIDDGAYCHDLRCYCKECDIKVERNLPLRLSEFCDCDQFTRWICLKCKTEENDQDSLYIQTRTRGEWDYRVNLPQDDGMWITSHQNGMAFWCPCSERAPIDGNIRCAWCSRRHNGTAETIMLPDNTYIPYFDIDPCQPVQAWLYERCHGRYPNLDYTARGFPIAP